MAIVQNANEEHQFVFAVNAISMVKSDALFSYIAPTNVIAWLLAPLRLLIPFRQFVRVNRTVIKVTHFPVLFIIYAYERLILRGTLFEPTDLVQRRGRPGLEVRAFETRTAGLHVFSPKLNRLREPSVATFQKDRALEEVFRRPFRDNTVRNTQKSHERRKTSNVVNHWMSNMGPNGTASPPVEQDRSIVDRLESRRVVPRRSYNATGTKKASRTRDFTEATTMSIVSDPEDFIGNGSSRLPFQLSREASELPTMSADGPTQTDADGDDELVTNDDEDLITLDHPMTTAENPKSQSTQYHESNDYFQHTPTARTRIPHFETSQVYSFKAKSSPPEQLIATRSTAITPPKRARHHNRIPSSTTIVYDPPVQNSSSSTSSRSRKAITARNSARNTGTATPNNLSTSAGGRTPKRLLTPRPAKPRPIMPARSAFQSAPDLTGMMGFNTRRDRRSSLTMDLGSDLGDNKAVGGGFVGAVPASLATQMAFATVGMRARNAVQREEDDQSRMSKLMLARMNALEEGFREVIKEVKDMRREGGEGKGKGSAKVKSKKEEKGGAKRKESPVEKEKIMTEKPAFALEEQPQRGNSL